MSYSSGSFTAKVTNGPGNIPALEVILKPGEKPPCSDTIGLIQRRLASELEMPGRAFQKVALAGDGGAFLSVPTAASQLSDARMVAVANSELDRLISRFRPADVPLANSSTRRSKNGDGGRSRRRAR